MILRELRFERLGERDGLRGDHVHQRPALRARKHGLVRALGGWIADILDARGADAAVSRVRGAALELCAAFPVYAPMRAGRES